MTDTSATAHNPPERCDLLIRGGTVVDGTGGPPVAADVAICDDRIAAVGNLGGLAADDEIEAADLVVAPGFIDVHTHDDRLLLVDPDVTPKASQGVTTVVVGNCGVSIAPYGRAGAPPPPLNLLLRDDDRRFPGVAAYLDCLDRAPAALNSAFLVGHTTLRAEVMGDDLTRPAHEDEIATMRELLAEGLEAGAIGLSSGLFYPPAQAAPASEVAALAELLAPVGGVLASHIRDEGDDVMAAIDEAAEIGRQAGARLQISHHKAVGRANYGRVRETLARIDEIRERQPIGLDAYPYTAGSTVLLPDLAAAAERVLIAWSEALPDAVGRDLADVAAELGCDEREACDRLQPAGAVYFAMSEEDVRRVLAYPRTVIGSDGLPGDVRPHPRLWGTFPRVLGHYVREVGLFALEEGVHRMTGLPASEFGLVDRGEVRPGAFADLVLFDPGTIEDRATYDDPMRPAAGIAAVFVNGRPVWRNGTPTGERPGRAIRRAGAPRTRTAN